MEDIRSATGGVGGWNNQRKIRINNFRSIKMEDFIDIKKITLLFGKNGSGKSSFIKAIKFLGQNLFPAQIDRSIYNLDHNIDLGDFKQIVFQNNVENKINIDFEEFWESDSESDGERKSNKFNYRINTLIEDNNDDKNFSAIKITDLINHLEFEIFPKEKNEYDEKLIMDIANREVSKEERELSFKRFFDKSVGYSGYPFNSIEINRNLNVIKPELKKFIKYLDVLPFFNTKDDFRFSYYNQLAEYLGYDLKQRKMIELFLNNFVRDIPTLAKKFFNHIYVTPVREKPKNNFELIGNKFNPRDYYGIPNQVDFRNQQYNKYYPGNDLKDILHFINNSLKGLGLGQELMINKNKGFGQVIIKDNYGFVHNLAESSSGLIQILPIIVLSYNALYEYENFVTLFDAEDFTDVVIIEQPELHLHPALQTKLVDFIYDGMGTYIIETHSEHIIRKLQVLIAQGKLNKNIVGVYYFDKDAKSGITSIKEMELDDNGLFTNPWPDGFFDDKMNLTLELLDAIRDRSN